ncbi:hypothetical protein GCM10022254_03370 [Actinomadura meridiana]|uniref:DUF2244 domain-containing protein n=1 Tax=Actinomadura meridiana TaxID=559626 RepID=A0ABP8BS36_9ACTN
MTGTPFGRITVVRLESGKKLHLAAPRSGLLGVDHKFDATVDAIAAHAAPKRVPVDRELVGTARLVLWVAMIIPLVVGVGLWRPWLAPPDGIVQRPRRGPRGVRERQGGRHEHHRAGFARRASDHQGDVRGLGDRAWRIVEVDTRYKNEVDVRLLVLRANVFVEVHFEARRPVKETVDAADALARKALTMTTFH